MALNRYALTVEVSDHSTQAVHAWHVAKMGFVTLLKIVMGAEKSLSWSGTAQWSSLSNQYTAALAVVYIG